MAKKSKGGKKKAGGKSRAAAPNRTRARAAAKPSKASQVGKQAAAIGGAVQKAVGNFAKSLGEMKIDPAQAAEQLEKIGMVLEDVAKAKNNADEKKEAAKTAQATFESKVNLMCETVRGFTHPKSLPLFDAGAREADQRNMLDAAADQGKPATEEAAPELGL